VLSLVLVDRAAEYIYRQTETVTLYRQLRRGFEPAQLAEALYESYAAHKFNKPPKDEIKALESFLKQFDHKLLSLFWAYWDHPRKTLPKELKQANEATYRQFGKIALDLELLKPVDLLIPGYGRAFLDLYLATTPDNLVDLVEALIEVEETDSLPRLIDYLPTLSGQELRQLNKLIDEEENIKNIPEPFHQAVYQALTAQPQDRGIKGTLRKMWRRLPGRG
jgi:hypothetical protein